MRESTTTTVTTTHRTNSTFDHVSRPGSVTITSQENISTITATNSDLSVLKSERPVVNKSPLQKDEVTVSERREGRDGIVTEKSATVASLDPAVDIEKVEESSVNVSTNSSGSDSDSCDDLVTASTAAISPTSAEFSSCAEGPEPTPQEDRAARRMSTQSTGSSDLGTPDYPRLPPDGHEFPERVTNGDSIEIQSSSDSVPPPAAFKDSMEEKEPHTISALSSGHKDGDEDQQNKADITARRIPGQSTFYPAAPRPVTRRASPAPPPVAPRKYHPEHKLKDNVGIPHTGYETAPVPPAGFTDDQSEDLSHTLVSPVDLLTSEGSNNQASTKSSIPDLVPVGDQGDMNSSKHIQEIGDSSSLLYVAVDNSKDILPEVFSDTPELLPPASPEQITVAHASMTSDSVFDENNGTNIQMLASPRGQTSSNSGSRRSSIGSDSGSVSSENKKAIAPPLQGTRKESVIDTLEKKRRESMGAKLKGLQVPSRRLSSGSSSSTSVLPTLTTKTQAGLPPIGDKRRSLGLIGLKPFKPPTLKKPNADSDSNVSKIRAHIETQSQVQTSELFKPKPFKPIGFSSTNKPNTEPRQRRPIKVYDNPEPITLKWKEEMIAVSAERRQMELKALPPVEAPYVSARTPPVPAPRPRVRSKTQPEYEKVEVPPLKSPPPTLPKPTVRPVPASRPEIAVQSSRPEVHLKPKSRTSSDASDTSSLSDVTSPTSPRQQMDYPASAASEAHVEVSVEHDLHTEPLVVSPLALSPRGSSDQSSTTSSVSSSSSLDAQSFQKISAPGVLNEEDLPASKSIEIKTAHRFLLQPSQPLRQGPRPFFCVSPTSVPKSEESTQPEPLMMEADEVTEELIQPVVKMVVKPESVVEPRVEPVLESAIEPIYVPTIDSSADSIGEPVIEELIEPSVAPKQQVHVFEAVDVEEDIVMAPPAQYEDTPEEDHAKAFRETITEVSVTTISTSVEDAGESAAPLDVDSVMTEDSDASTVVEVAPAAIFTPPPPDLLPQSIAEVSDFDEFIVPPLPAEGPPPLPSSPAPPPPEFAFLGVATDHQEIIMEEVRVIEVLHPVVDRAPGDVLDSPTNLVEFTDESEGPILPPPQLEVPESSSDHPEDTQEASVGSMEAPPGDAAKTHPPDLEDLSEGRGSILSSPEGALSPPSPTPSDADSGIDSAKSDSARHERGEFILLMLLKYISTHTPRNSSHNH